MSTSFLKLGLIFLSIADFQVDAAIPKVWRSRKGEKGFPSLGRGLGSGVLGSRGRAAESAVRQTWTFAICESGAKVVSDNKTINDNLTDSCARCFLNVTQDQMFSESGGRITQNCSRSFLSSDYEMCNAMFDNSSSSEAIMNCFQETFKRAEVRKCLGNSTDEVDRYMEASLCIKQKIRDFKKYVRLVMVDKVLGKSGCSFAAIVALKMFGAGMSGKGGDRLDSIIDEMVQDKDQEDFDKPNTRPNYSTKPYIGKGRGNKRPKGKGNYRSKRQSGGFEEDEDEEESGYESYMSDGFDEELDEEDF